MPSSPSLIIFYTLFFHHCSYSTYLNGILIYESIIPSWIMSPKSTFAPAQSPSIESSFVVEQIYKNLGIFKTKTSGMEDLKQEHITNHEHQQRCYSPWVPKQGAQQSHFCIFVWRTKLSVCQLHHLNRLSIIQDPLQQLRVNFKLFDSSEVSKTRHLSSHHKGNEVDYGWHARAGHTVTRLSWKYYSEGVWKWKEDLRKL